MKVEIPVSSELEEISGMSEEIPEGIFVKNENEFESWEEASYDSESETEEIKVSNADKKRKLKFQNRASTTMKKKFYVCDICDSKFRSKPVMNQHFSEAHEGKKSLVCIVCDSSSSDRKALNRHIINVHDGEKGDRNYDCTKCDANFESKSLLKQHVLLVHEKKKAFKCKICNNSFTQKVTKRNKTNENRNYICSFIQLHLLLKLLLSLQFASLFDEVKKITFLLFHHDI